MSAGADDFLDEYKEALAIAAKAGAREKALDEKRRIVFSEQVRLHMGESAIQAEHAARASQAYKDVVAELDAAREEAALAGALVIDMQTRFETWRTRCANRRTTKGT